MIAISTHACERYVERVLNMDSAMMTPTMCTSMREKLKVMFHETHKICDSYPNGSYRVPSGDCTCKVVDNCVVTVTELHCDSTTHKGGIVRSGKKIKKTKVRKCKLSMD